MNTKTETIYDRAERSNIWAEEREKLEAQYNSAKARKDWPACNRAVEAMRDLGGCPR